jgi:polar amino acid transport system substrate-binding protein
MGKRRVGLTTLIIALALAVPLVVLLGACGQSSEPSGPAPASPSASAAAAPLRMVGNENMGFLEMKDGKPTGFSADLAAEIAAQLGRPLEVEMAPFDKLFTTLLAGGPDIAMSAITITPERQQTMAFSTPYFDSGQSLLVRKDSGIRSIAGLKGKNLGVCAGSTNEAYAEKIPGVSHVIAYETRQELLDAMRRGTIEAAIRDTPFALYEAAHFRMLRVAQELTTGDHYGIALRKDETALRQQIDEALVAIDADGTYDEVYQKYFGE